MVKNEKQHWVLPNRFMFTKWIYHELNPERYVVAEGSKKGTFDADPSQKLIRDYINTDTPYRGLLVYHGLGTGKTCSAIIASDNFLTNNKKIVLLLPASLENNFKKELVKCSSTGSLLKGRWTQLKLELKRDLELLDVLDKKLKLSRKFIEKAKGIVWVPSYVAKNLDDSLILQKDIPFKQLSVIDRSSVKLVYDYLIDNRYAFLHYNGLTNKKLDELEKLDDYGEDLFDNSIVVIDEVHTFISRVVNGGKIARRLYNHLIAKQNIRFILLSGTPVINHPFELCFTLNLLRGPMKEYTIHSLKNKELPDLAELIDYIHTEQLYQHIDTIDVDPSKTKLVFTLMPRGFVREFKNTNKVIKGPLYKDADSFINKLVSTLKKKFDVHARHKTNEYAGFPDKHELFLEHFLDNRDPLNPTVKKDAQELFMRRLQGLVSYYRVSDESLFPTALPIILKKIPMSDYQFSYYSERRNDEIKQEDIKQKKEIQMKKVGTQAGLFQTTSSYRANSRMSCNFVFPKEIPRPFPKDIRARLIKKEIDIQEDDAYSSGASSAEPVAQKANESSADANKMYDRDVKAALKKLDTGNYLEATNLQVFSPKMYTLLQDLTANTNTKGLLYSQFRTVEGLRIFRMVLDHAGWIEIDFKELGNGDWTIVNHTTVLDPKYNNKRYLVFGTKEKTDLLIGLFNADIQNLPKTIKEQLAELNFTQNLTGNLVSLLMITQSGAEGINLRNVRFVYILEPFWNQVRIDQVIGRAIRKRSHLELPPEQRNVQVIMYISTFTEHQATMNKTIKIKDNSKTTDENIMEIATRKNMIIQQFLSMLKANAFDCLFHAPQNKPLEHNYQCYIPALNTDMDSVSYTPNFELDTKTTVPFGMVKRTKKIKGKAVMFKGHKYVVIDGSDTLYDYPSYKYAGVLVDALVKS